MTDPLLEQLCRSYVAVHTTQARAQRQHTSVNAIKAQLHESIATALDVEKAELDDVMNNLNVYCGADVTQLKRTHRINEAGDELAEYLHARHGQTD